MKTLTKSLAIDTVLSYLRHQESHVGCELALAAVDENDHGWVFYYNSKQYFETNEVSYALAGNGPILIDKEDGKLYAFGTAESTEDYLKNFELNKEQFTPETWPEQADTAANTAAESILEADH
jgi:hypothetical protein